MSRTGFVRCLLLGGARNPRENEEPYSLQIQNRTRMNDIDTTVEAIDTNAHQTPETTTTVTAVQTNHHLLTGTALCPTQHPTHSLQSPSRIVRVFLSSTFTDTRHERDLFNIWMVPRLKQLCTQHGLEFHMSEMRWGIDDNLGRTHQTSAVCIDELRRCLRESAAINFVGFLFNKYGFRPFPSVVAKPVFDTLLAEITDESAKNLLTSWFTLDTNTHKSQGGAFVLAATSDKYPDCLLEGSTPAEKDAKDEADRAWWSDFASMQHTLRGAALAAKAKNKLDQDTVDLFIQSVTQEEMSIGVLKESAIHTTMSGKASKAVLVLRELDDIVHENQISNRFTDNNDADAQALLRELKATLRSKIPDENVIELPNIAWDNEHGGFDPLHNDEHAQSLHKLMARLWGVLSASIVNIAKRRASMQHDPLVEEVRHHVLFAHEKTRMFAARKDVVQQVRDALSSSRITLVHGVSGTGKTSVVAKVLQDVMSAATLRLDGGSSEVSPFSSNVLALRFLGTTPASSTSSDVMRSLMHQLHRVYSQTDLAPPPPSATEKELIELFPQFLEPATEGRSLLLALDSLDQLRQGLDLQWLPMKQIQTSSSVRLLLSTLPDDHTQRCLSIVQQTLESGGGNHAFVEIHPLSTADVHEMLDGWLHAANRQLTAAQSQLMNSQFEKVHPEHQTPLLLWLLYNMSTKWTSSWEPQPNTVLPQTTQDAVNRVFDEVEKNCNSTLTKHALAFITAARDGLSEDELADLLSTNDTVLDACFEWWLPPVVRVPPLMVTRLLTSLGDFLVARGTTRNGTPLLGWYHRQFFEAANTRYLEKTKQETHAQLAVYFCSQWVDGKPYQARGKFEQFVGEPTDPNRQITAQPLILPSGAPNLRRLRERMHHLLTSENWTTAIDELVNLENQYVAAKLRANMFDDLMGEVLWCCNGAKSHPRSNEVDELKRFLSNNHDILQASPDCFFDLAANAPTNTILCERACKHLAHTQSSLWKWTTRAAEFDAQLMSLPHVAEVTSCSCSPDGKLLVTGICKNVLKVWDTDTGRVVLTLDGHTNWVKDCKFSPDGSQILSTSTDKTARIWDSNTGRTIHVLTSHGDRIDTCAYSPDGTRIVTGSVDKTLKIWDSRSATELLTLQGHKHTVCASSFSPDGKRVISGSYDKTLKVWDVETGKELTTLTGHTGWINSCVFSMDGKYIVTASADATIKIWDAENMSTLKTLEGHTKSVMGCVLSPKNDLIASASQDKSLKLWTFPEGNLLATLEGHVEQLRSCTFTPDGSRVISTSQDKTARFWDVNARQASDTREHHTALIRAGVFSRDATKLATSSLDKTVKIWNAATGSVIHTLTGHKGAVRACAFTIDGKRVASGSDDRTVKIWDVEIGAVVASLEGKAKEVYSCEFSPDGKKLVLGCFDKVLRVWDIEAGDAVQSLEGHANFVYCCAFSPNGEFVLSGSQDKTVRLWACNTGTMVHCLEGHAREVRACTFSPDGNTIASASQDKTVKLWNTNSGELLHTLEGHIDWVVHVEFSADGEIVISRDNLGRVLVFNAKTGVLMPAFESQTTSIGRHPTVRGAVVLSKGTPNTTSILRIGEEVPSVMGIHENVAFCVVDSTKVHFFHHQDL